MAGVTGVTGVTVRMKLSALSHSSHGKRVAGGAVGLALAATTVAVAALAPLAVAPTLLAGVLAVWLVGWIVGPTGVGGGDETVRAEYFTLLPLRARQVALGVLGAAFVGVTVPVTLVATASLVVLGARFGLVAALVALVAVPLQVVVTVLLSKVVMGLLGTAMRTRLGVEIAAVQFAAIITFLFLGWMVFWVFQEQSEVLTALLSEGVPEPLATILLALPSGWGAAAVQAAGQGRWLLALGALAASAALAVGLLYAWSALLVRRVTEPATSSTRRRRTGRVRRRLLPATPLGAVVSRELRTWAQDPRRTLELRVALWSGAMMCGVALLAGWSFLVPMAGVVTLFMAMICSLNIYALDGSALWHTLLTPGAERVDVRGRQVAWLLVFAPVAVGLSVLGIAVTGQWWAWPWVAAGLPALIGGGAGLVVLFAVSWPAPGAEPHRHAGNPLDSGDVSTQVNVMLLVAGLPALPALAVTGAGAGLNLPVLLWAGPLVGLATGVGLAWWLGRLAYRNLESGGPELLNLLRRGALPPSRAKKREAYPGAVRDQVLMTALGSVFWLPLFPQGLVPLVMVLTGSDTRSWFLAMYLPEPFRSLLIAAMIALGGWMLYAMKRVSDRAKEKPRPTPDPRAVQREPERVDS